MGHVGEVCESKRSYVLEVPDVDLSGPVELLFLHCFISSWTCVVVSGLVVVCSFSIYVSICVVVSVIVVVCSFVCFPIYVSV